MSAASAPDLLNRTHDPTTGSWVEDADGHAEFPIQNLPLAVFRRAGNAEPFRGGVAIGDAAVDLGALAATSMLADDARSLARLAAASTLNDFMAAGPAAWRTLRHALFDLLSHGADARCREAVSACLVARAEVEFALPARIGNYTDFYTSIHHARNVGRVIRPDDPLTPNFQWLPIAYHGRASSVVVGGTPFHRPMGQAKASGATTPAFGPSARLDFELEMGFWIGCGNALGQPIAIDNAEEHVFGLCLLNDWSARDHQFWEMDPLGPFLGKNFCTSVSPWIVTMEALAPFRTAFDRPSGDPPPMHYLDGAANRAAGGIDVQLAVAIDTAAHRERRATPSEVSRTTFRHQYWTLAQMVTQHTVGGCNLQPGDLIGTGTISGPTPSEAGAMVELSRGGTQAVTLAATGEERRFLEDGDTVILRGWCEREGAARIGFGECGGSVLPALRR